MKRLRHVVQWVLVLTAIACLPACQTWRPESDSMQADSEPLRPAVRQPSQTPSERFFFNEKSREIEKHLGL